MVGSFRQIVPGHTGPTTTMKLPKTKEELRRLLELRRSNAARPLTNKKKYTRKTKYNDAMKEGTDEN